jgi:hypothetical protein
VPPLPSPCGRHRAAVTATVAALTPPPLPHFCLRCRLSAVKLPPPPLSPMFLSSSSSTPPPPPQNRMVASQGGGGGGERKRTTRPRRPSSGVIF